MPAAKPSFVANIQRGHPLAQGVICTLPLHEGGGFTASDVSGQGNNGTISSTGVTWVGGQSGWCLSGSGEDSTARVSLPGSVTTILNGVFSIALWVYITGLPSANLSFLTGVKNRTHSRVLAYAWSGANTLTFGEENISNAFSVPFAAATYQNIWTHICGTYDGTTQRIYVNAALAGTNAYTWNGSDSGVYQVGSAASAVLLGSFDVPTFYNRALSQPEIAALYADSWAAMRRRSTPFASTGKGKGYGGRRWTTQVLAQLHAEQQEGRLATLARRRAQDARQLRSLLDFRAEQYAQQKKLEAAAYTVLLSEA